MYFFVNPIAPPKRLTGVEAAEYARYRVFKKNKIPVCLVSLQFNQFLKNNCASYELNPGDVCNLYDYFCRIDYKRSQAQTDHAPADFDLCQPDGLLTRYFLAGRLVRKVRHSASGAVISVYDYNAQRQSLCVTFFRPSGFAAMQQWYEAQGHMRSDYLDQNGRVCLTAFFGGGNQPRGFILKNWGSQPLTFQTEGQLAGYFLDQITAAATKPVMIADHSSDLLPSFQAMKRAVPRYAFIHAALQIKDGAVAGYYRPLAAHLAGFQGVIVSTKAQQLDLQKLWPAVSVFRASVSVVADTDLQAPVPAFARRQPNQLVMLARVDPAKDILAAVQILKAVRQNLPAATLEIWGSANVEAFAAYRQSLDFAIKQLGLTAVVHFRGYTASPSKVLDSARLLLMTSRSEGTGLVINEALARGVPVVSYDFKYGPREFIRDGDNGYLVETGDSLRAARCCVDLLTQEKAWTRHSLAARKRAVHYDSAHNWHQWQQVLKTIQGAK